MPEQVRESLQIFDADGETVFMIFEVLESMGSHMVARDLDGRVVFEFRPAVLRLGVEGNAGGLLIRDQDGVGVFGFNATNARLRLGAVEHLADAILTGNLTVLDSSSREVLTFDSAEAALSLGAANQAGRLAVKDTLNQDALRFSATGAELRVGNLNNPGELAVRDGDNRTAFFFRSDFAELRLGAEGNAGNIILLDEAGREVMRTNGENGTLFVGAQENGGTLLVRDTRGRDAFSFDTGQDSDNQFFPSGAFARIGTREATGRLEVRDDQDRTTMRFTSQDANLEIGAAGSPGRFEVVDRQEQTVFLVESEARDPGGSVATPGAPPPAVGSTAKVKIGGTRVDGDLVIEDGQDRSALHFNSSEAAVLRFGSQDREGRLIIKNSDNREVFSVETDQALVHFGSDTQERILMDGKSGRIVLRDENNERRIGINATTGQIWLKDSNGDERIRIDGEAGDILFKNADVAEQFDVADEAGSPPGTVMVLGDDKKLHPCSSPYDHRVAGVVAGAGAYRPGILMDAGAVGRPRVPISIFGKVSCKADASAGPIRVGDLLTTSSTPGHAMRAGRSEKAFGAVIGKALSPLERGTGSVEMLISLQ